MTPDLRHQAWISHQVAEELSSALAALVDRTPEGRPLHLTDGERAVLRSLAFQLTQHLSVIEPAAADTPMYRALHGQDELAPYRSEAQRGDRLPGPPRAPDVPGVAPSVRGPR